MSENSTDSTESKPSVYLGLGSNLDNPPQQLLEGIQLIMSHFKVDDIEVSSIYKTPPMGGKNQPDYYNLVCRFLSRKNPLEILNMIQSIEDKQGRIRTEHWGSRTLDIDILLVGDTVSLMKDLQIPHPGIPERNFVLGPLLEITPDLLDPLNQIPYQKYWDELSPEAQQSLVKVK